MQISYRGQNYFRVKTKNIECFISPEKIKIDQFEITEPGEYEIKNIAIESIDHTWVIELEGVNLCFLNRVDLNEAQLEKLKNIDILLIQPEKAYLKIIEEIDPNFVLLVPESEIENFVKAESVEPEYLSSLTITKNDLSDETRRFIILQGG